MTWERSHINLRKSIVGRCIGALGNLRAGMVAAATSGGASLAIGGLTGVTAAALIALTTPALRKFALRPSAVTADD